MLNLPAAVPPLLVSSLTQSGYATATQHSCKQPCTVLLSGNPAGSPPPHHKPAPMHSSTMCGASRSAIQAPRTRRLQADHQACAEI